jgi:hypothetical protein
MLAVTHLRSRAIVMTLAVAWLPYITGRCIDPAACPTEHTQLKRHDHGDHIHEHCEARGHHGIHDETPTPGTPTHTCCDLTGKSNIVASEGVPSVTPVFLSAPLAVPVVPERRPDQPHGDFVAHTAHGPPTYLRNHTLLI